MKGDFSRLTFDKKKNYNGVLKQQGRVSLDADWNELIDIIAHQRRSRTIDTIGGCGAPIHASGYEIRHPGNNRKDLLISTGRFYTDGLLCELHPTSKIPVTFPAGTTKQVQVEELKINGEELAKGQWLVIFTKEDPKGILTQIIGDVNTTTKILELNEDISSLHSGTFPHLGHMILYSQQPNYPNAPDWDPVNGQTDLIYLDVWKRHITAIEDPEAREVALGGPDTATRIQTIAQVKILRNVGNIHCSDDVQEWNEEIAPSGGRLKTKPTVGTEPEYPCLIAEGGGYRGLENRLYRVEIHEGGDLGKATFKWSRDNGSTAYEIKDFIEDVGDPTKVFKVKLKQIGRDEILKIKKDDWLEISGDETDLHVEKAGTIAQIVVEVDEAQQILTLSEDVASHKDETHPKARRWDTGLNTVTPPTLTADGPIKLEDGIEIYFSGNNFKVGDYWVFDARTSTGKIDELDYEPPRGIKHHYCKLALVKWHKDGPVEIEDCRKEFPPLTEIEKGEGCCTVVVHPGEDIQAALDALPESGGCVCLKRGTHTIPEPIRIEKSNVIVQGESPGTKVERNSGLNLVTISDPTGKQISNVTVEGIGFALMPQGDVTDEKPPAIIVDLDNCNGITVRNCEMRVASAPKTGLPMALAVGVCISRSTNVDISNNHISLMMVGVWGMSSDNLDVSENTITGPTLEVDSDSYPVEPNGVLIEGTFEAGSHLRFRQSYPFGCKIERNRIENYLFGVSVDSVWAGRAIITGNEVLRPGTPARESEELFSEKFYGIEVTAPDCIIAGNYLNLASPSYGGIRATGAHTCVEGNHLLSEAQEAEGQIPLGIFMGPKQKNPDRLPDHGVVRGNTLRGLLDGILVTDADGVQVLENHVEGNQNATPRLAIAISKAKNTVVAGNQIRDAELGVVLGQGTENRILTNRLVNGGSGIVAESETGLEVSHNVVENMRAVGLLGYALLFETTTITHNRFASCGYEGTRRNKALGVYISFSFGDLHVESCEVMNTGISLDGKFFTTNRAVGIWAFYVPSCRISGNRVAYTDPSKLDLTKEHRALVLVGPPSSRVADRVVAFGSALVVDNVFYGAGFSHLVEFKQIEIIADETKGDFIDYRFEKVTFNNNYCEHISVPDKEKDDKEKEDKATVSFWGNHLIVIGNHVKAAPEFSSMNFNFRRNVALMGNVTTGDFINLGSSVPTPHTHFNVKL